MVDGEESRQHRGEEKAAEFADYQQQRQQQYQRQLWEGHSECLSMCKGGGMVMARQKDSHGRGASGAEAAVRQSIIT
jgi:hypothetical protein